MSAPGLLVLTPQHTSTGLLLAQAAEARGLLVEQLPGRVVPQGLRDLRPAHLYGGPLFAEAVAPQLGIRLLQPTAEWLAMLPPHLTGRSIRLLYLEHARDLHEPFFGKPPSEKLFAAEIYPNGGFLPTDLPPETLVQVSDIVTFASEFRLFVLDGEVRTAARYATFGRLDPAPLADCPERFSLLEFADVLLRDPTPGLPRACVLDIGLILPDGAGEPRWGVVEANMGWFSHLYACAPEDALDVVLGSAASPEAS
ncbi:ATP-grasp domain-containing protein [Streptomyces sp. TP-A0874]|uniref:ATP-grasp domain-containing protein n=1 Tax=Streptomyces sp. TP-A0874 TaxID=549819 RepID=UPI000852B00F|nr:ATP-grasp domain-containing protein [Streptomyces sp. TP-A0874]